MEILFYFLVCVGATTVGGISGVGGGVIIKPVMDAVSGLPVSTISFLSGCTVLGMTGTSLLRARGGPVKVEARRGTALAVGAALGGVAGKEIFELVRALGAETVSAAQQVMMILLTLGVLVYTLNRSRIRSLNVEGTAACGAIGLVLGVMSAFLGIGGGPINVALIIFLFSYDTKTAAVCSLITILFAQLSKLGSIALTTGFAAFDLRMAPVMIVGAIAGGFIGAGLNRRCREEAVERAFNAVQLLVLAIAVVNIARNRAH